MDDARNPELTKTTPDLGAIVQVSSDATRKLCEHEQREGDSAAQQAATRSCVHVPVSFVCLGYEAEGTKAG